MRHIAISSAILCGLGVLISCGDERPRESTVSVMGGSTELNKNFPYVGKLTTYVDEGFGRARNNCTASLITEDVLLTAAHCIDDRLGIRDGLFEVAGMTVQLSSFVKVNGKSPSRLPELLNSHADVALVRLASPLDITPVTIYAGESIETSMRTMGTGEYLNLLKNQKEQIRFVSVGYGSTVSNEVVDGDLGGKKNSSWVNYRGVWGMNAEDFVYGSRNRAACRGDSGGPLLLWTNNRFEVVGVASRQLSYDAHEMMVSTGPTCSKYNSASLATNLRHVDFNELLGQLPAAEAQTDFHAEVRAINVMSAKDKEEKNLCNTGNPYFAGIDVCGSGELAFVGYIEPGEYLEYQTPGPQFPEIPAGAYTLTLDLATPNSSRCMNINAMVNNREVNVLNGAKFCAEATGNFGVWKKQSLEIQIPEDTAALRIKFLSNGIDFRSFTITAKK